MNYPFGVITSHMSDRLLEERAATTVSTPWGDAKLYTGKIGSVPTVVELRYGDDADIAAHLINYRANMWAMRKLGVKFIVSQNAIGSCNPKVLPGSYMVPDDAMDFTKNRVRGFFDEDECWVRVDMTSPFCEELRTLLIQGSKENGIAPREKGTFVCAEGPRFETPAEVRFYHSAGGDILGTPLFPEIVLAKEAGICYASFAMVINMCTGLGPPIIQGGSDGLMDVYESTNMEEHFENILGYVSRHLPEEQSCECRQALANGFYGKKPAWLTDGE